MSSRILGVSWHDKCQTLTFCPTLISQPCTCCSNNGDWLGHVHRMEDGRMPKDILYGELTSRKRTVDRPELRFLDVCRRDMTALQLDTTQWEWIGKASSKNTSESGRKISGSWQRKREPDGRINFPLQPQRRSTNVATVTETVTPASACSAIVVVAPHPPRALSLVVLD